MTLAEVTLDVPTVYPHAAPDFSGDLPQAAGVAAQTAPPSGERAGAAVFVGNLAEAEEFGGLAGHSGTLVRLYAR